MSKAGADKAKDKKPAKRLKRGALADAIEAHANAPSPLAEADITDLHRVQARFAAGARGLHPDALDVAVLHLWDVGACWGNWPAWAEARLTSLTERGFFNEMSGHAALVAGETTLSTLGMKTICMHAGRELTDPAPRKCKCAICVAAQTPGFSIDVSESAPEILAPPQTGSDYRAFLEGKIRLAPFEGIEPGPINPALAPHAREMVRWALRGGRRAIFANFGLHKTATQIELARQATIDAMADNGAARDVKRRGFTVSTGPDASLIVIPLGVRQEFTREAVERFKGEYAVRLVFIRTDGEFLADAEARAESWSAKRTPTIYLTNYESVREGKITPSLFVCASLDEAAVLRSFGSKTYQEFMPLFEGVRFRFVATATPSPNRLKELIHYAGFLGVMDTGQALTRFFQRNSEKANDLTLYPHKEVEFWLWVHSWAVFLQRPSDLGAGFSDEGFSLPPLNVHWHELPSDHSEAGVENDGQKLLFKDAALGLKEAAAEKRDSIDARVGKLLEIVAAADDPQVVAWCHLNDEQAAIEKGLKGQGVSFISLAGADDLDEREGQIEEWKAGQHRAFVSKPEMYGAGANLQASHTMVFVGINYSFHDLIQAVHRIYRFGQKLPCDVHFIHTEAEREIVADVKRKWALHDDMQAKMAEIIRTYGLDHSAMSDNLKRSIGVARREVRGERFWIANNDCVLEARSMEENSVGQIITSIPFANQYEYTPQYEDMGHTDNNEHFWAQMDFLTPELLRILQPGRVACIHVKDRIDFGKVTGKGVPTVSPFHAEAIFHFRDHGFDYLGMITVVTDVVRENNQTYRLGWSEVCKDGTKMGVGSPEYVLIFRKPQSDRSKAYADVPVVKSKDDYTRARWQVDAHAFWRSSGNRLVGVEELAALGPDKLAKAFTLWSLTETYDYEAHISIGEALEGRGALPATFMAIAPGSHHPDVWHDVNRMATLNSEQSRRRVEMHVCPLQFDIVDRLIERYSNKDELVFDPFAGLGTVPVRAMLKGRRGAGSELNPDSFRDAVFYCTTTEKEATAPTLFALMEAEEASEAAA